MTTAFQDNPLAFQRSPLAWQIDSVVRARTGKPKPRRKPLPQWYIDELRRAEQEAYDRAVMELAAAERENRRLKELAKRAEQRSLAALLTSSQDASTRVLGLLDTVPKRTVSPEVFSRLAA